MFPRPQKFSRFLREKHYFVRETELHRIISFKYAFVGKQTAVCCLTSQKNDTIIKMECYVLN